MIDKIINSLEIKLETLKNTKTNGSGEVNPEGFSEFLQGRIKQLEEVIKTIKQQKRWHDRYNK